MTLEPARQLVHKRRQSNASETVPATRSHAIGGTNDEQVAALSPNSGRHSYAAQAAALSPLQMKDGAGGGDAGALHAAADRATSSAAGALPHLDKIQASFGRHDVSGIRAHMGGAATAACREMGAAGFARGNHVALAGADLHTAAHEAAHVLQQKAGVKLKSGVGQANDAHERHADEVADAVVRGESAEGLIDQYASGAGGGTAASIQLQGAPDFDDLDAAYDKAVNREQRLWEMAAVGCREVGKNYAEMDSPTVGQILLNMAAMGALGFASRGFAAAVAGAKSDSTGDLLRESVKLGIDSALKNGAKDAVQVDLKKNHKSSRSSYLAGVEGGFLALKQAGVDAIAESRREDKKAIRAKPALMAERIAGVKEYYVTVEKLQPDAADKGYAATLQSWMSAMSRAELGKDETAKGTDMDEHPNYGGDPSNILRSGSVDGTIKITFGLKEAKRPLKINGIQVAGINQAIKKRIKDLRIKDLKVPIFAQGWIHDGFLDGVEKGDNECTFARNEDGTVWSNVGSDVSEAMLKSGFAKGKRTVNEVARDILENDLGNKKFGQVKWL